MAAKTVERIKTMLAGLPQPPRIKVATMEALCARRGPLGKDPERLAARLKELEKTL